MTKHHSKHHHHHHHHSKRKSHSKNSRRRRSSRSNRHHESSSSAKPPPPQENSRRRNAIHDPELFARFLAQQSSSVVMVADKDTSIEGEPDYVPTNSNHHRSSFDRKRQNSVSFPDEERIKISRGVSTQLTPSSLMTHKMDAKKLTRLYCVLIILSLIFGAFLVITGCLWFAASYYDMPKTKMVTMATSMASAGLAILVGLIQIILSSITLGRVNCCHHEATPTLKFWTIGHIIIGLGCLICFGLAIFSLVYPTKMAMIGATADGKAATFSGQPVQLYLAICMILIDLLFCIVTLILIFLECRKRNK